MPGEVARPRVLLNKGTTDAHDNPTIMLDDYDRYGMQIDCGNGYHSELLQAQVEDQTPEPQPPAATEATGDHVERCLTALAHRRKWAVPTAAVGFVMLVPGLVKWARASATSRTDESGDWSIAHPEQALHQAALLDRQAHRRFDRSHDTTL